MYAYSYSDREVQNKRFFLIIETGNLHQIFRA